MKALKENILDELELTQKSVAKDLSYEETEYIKELKLDVEGRYNMEDVNNTEAVGYDNLNKRFNDPENNY